MKAAVAYAYGAIGFVQDKFKGENKMLRIGALLAIAIIGSGCAYQVPAVRVSAPNIYSTYDNKISGNYALVLDDSVTNISREIKASSHVCSAHTYPLNLGDSAGTAVKNVMTSLFENMSVRTSMPSMDEMRRSGLNGVFVVKLDTLDPRLNCQMGFFSGTCSASADVAFGVTGTGPSGRLLGFSVSGSKVADGSAGGACEGASMVLGDAISRSMKDALERMGERISNAPSLRKR